MYFFRKFKKPILIVLAISLLLVLLSQTSFGKRIFLEAGILDAIRNFLNLQGDTLSAADYKNGTILLIKPVATGVGEGRYEAGDIVEIRDGEEMYKRFGIGNFLGSEERTMLLPLYYPAKLTDEQKRELTAPDEKIVETENGTTTEMVKRRQVGVDYTKFLNTNEILKIRSFEKLDKLPEIDLSAIVQKNPGQLSAVQLSKPLALIEKTINLTKYLAKSIVKPAFADVPETVKIVDTGNGPGTHYTSLNDWEGAMQDDLVSTSTPYISVAKCRSTTGAADTALVTINGWTTDADHYIKIWTDPNESYRNNGKWDTSKYRIHGPSGGGSIITTYEIDVKIEGLQFYGTDVESNSAINMPTNDISYNVEISQNLFWHFHHPGGGTIIYSWYGYGVTAWNNIIYDCDTAIFGFDNSKYYNNTIANCATGIVGGTRGYDGYPLVKNNLVSSTTDSFSGTFDGDSDYNSVSDGAATGGDHDLINQTFTFVSETPGSEDYHLQSTDAGAKDYGISLNPDPDGYLSFSDDIDGQTRSAPWDIGADEYVSGVSCGDGTCNGSETHATCPADCPITQINTPLSGRFLDSSLKGYWSFDGADMDWSQTTAEARDLSGNGNHGDVTNFGKEAARPGGVAGQALSFDGVDDRVSVPNAPSLKMSGKAITISFWTKLNSLYSAGGEREFVIKGIPSLNNYQLWIKPLSPYTSLGFDFGQTGAWHTHYSGDGFLETGGWVHIAVVYDGSSSGYVYFYKNGNEFYKEAETANLTDNNDSNLLIGYAELAIDGVMDEVRVYNRALSASEIAEQYRAGAARLKVNTPITLAGPQSGLVGNWTFNGADMNATTAYDRSGQSPANNGDVNGATKVIGISGQALSFDGSDDYVESASNIDITTAFTFTAWIQAKDELSTFGGLFHYGTTAGYGGSIMFNYNINVASNIWIIQTFLNQGSVEVNTGWMQGIPSDYFHLVVTYDSSLPSNNIKIYIDNVLKGQGDYSSSIVDTNKNIYIGHTQWNWYSCYLNGSIDEVRVYSRALSADEILELYRLGTRKVKF